MAAQTPVPPIRVTRWTAPAHKPGRHFPDRATAEALAAKGRITSVERLAPLALHPDEVVRAALIGTLMADHARPAHRRRPLLEYLLTWRALADAEAEGVLWTPMLDDLALHNLWRETPPSADYDLPGIAAITGCPVGKRLRSARAQATRVIDWAVTAPPSIVGPALQGRWSVLRREVLTALPVIDETLVAFIVNHAPWLAAALVPLSTLTEEARAHLELWTTYLLLGRVPVKGPAARQVHPDPTTFHGNDARICAPAIFAAYAQHGVSVSAETRAAIHSAFADPTRPETVRRDAWTVLLQHLPDLTADDLAVVVTNDLAPLLSDRDWIDLVANPLASPPVHRAALTASASASVRLAVARAQGAMADPDVVEALLASRSAEVLTHILMGASPPAASLALSTLVAAKPAAVLELAAQGALPVPLRTADIQPLLGSSVEERRHLALRLLAFIPPDDEPDCRAADPSSSPATSA